MIPEGVFFETHQFAQRVLEDHHVSQTHSLSTDEGLQSNTRARSTSVESYASTKKSNKSTTSTGQRRLLRCRLRPSCAGRVMVKSTSHLPVSGSRCPVAFHGFLPGRRRGLLETGFGSGAGRTINESTIHFPVTESRSPVAFHGIRPGRDRGVGKERFSWMGDPPPSEDSTLSMFLVSGHGSALSDGSGKQVR